MNDLVIRQPADTEAMIFYAISLAASAPPTDKTYANQLKAGSILEPLWAKQPNHPGLAHYIIHTYDYPPLADKARAAAERYASIAPSAAHALHMPAHTFTRVGLWQESIDANNRSMKVAQGSGSIAEALHAADYAMYAYLQLGKETEAKAILDGLPALASRFDVNAITRCSRPAGFRAGGDPRTLGLSGGVAEAGPRAQGERFRTGAILFRARDGRLRRRRFGGETSIDHWLRFKRFLTKGTGRSRLPSSVSPPRAGSISPSTGRAMLLHTCARRSRAKTRPRRVPSHRDHSRRLESCSAIC